MCFKSIALCFGEHKDQVGWGGGHGTCRKSKVKIKQKGICMDAAACARGWAGRKLGGPVEARQHWALGLHCRWDFSSEVKESQGRV